jgi:tRNA (mo5U34)-methyltransferase
VNAAGLDATIPCYRRRAWSAVRPELARPGEGPVRYFSFMSDRPVITRTHAAANELRAEVAAIRWYHTIDLGGGIVTPGADNTPERLARLDLPASFAGKTALDIGAWDGFFSFEAERRGASRVLATDSYSWSGKGWGTQAGFNLARRSLESRVEDLTIDVMDLDPARTGQFDVVFFLGVLYHLRHPLLALERVASVTREMLILETVVDCVGFGRPAAAFYPGTELNHDPTNWWGPNQEAVAGMLTSVGFDEVRVVTPARSWPFRAARAIYHQAKGRNRANLAFRQDRAVFHAFRTGSCPAGG